MKITPAFSRASRMAAMVCSRGACAPFSKFIKVLSATLESFASCFCDQPIKPRAALHCSAFIFALHNIRNSVMPILAQYTQHEGKAMTMMNTNRRNMLLGLAAASTAAATGASGESTPQESGDLLALADTLGDTLEAYRRADEQVDQIVREWGPKWPAPDMRIARYGPDCKTHRDILGRGIKTQLGNGDIMDVQDLGTPEHFEQSARRGWAEYERKMQTKSKRGAKAAKSWAEREAALIEPARQYWSEVDRITEASGIEAAEAARSDALEALRQLVGQIVLYREKTVTGLIIKAQAMQAWEAVEPFQRRLNPYGQAWAEAMTATVLRRAL